MSPQVAGSLGGALDPSKGFDFNPRSGRPADLPEPGQAPGGGEQFTDGPAMFDPGTMIGDQMAAHQQGLPPGGLPDDHDALLGPGIGPGVPLPQADPRIASRVPLRGPQEPRTVPISPIPEHPILTALREDVGLETIEPKDVEIGGHRWTLRVLSPGELSRASSIADSRSVTLTERELVFHAAVAAHSVIAIDGAPLYQIFGVEAAPGVIITDHLRPPRPIRYMAAAALYDFITDNGKTELAKKLKDAYDEECDRDGAVRSYLDAREDKKVRFRCQEKGCGFELLIIPQVDTRTGEVKLPFCQYDGSSMPIVAAETETDLPLA